MLCAQPLAPDLSPYSGRVWELEFSTYRQATSFSTRVRYANSVSTEGVFDEVVADELTGSSAGNNPTWCAWGPAPNAAWLIARNGTVVVAQTWFDHAELNATLAPTRSRP
jgi:hypothetical protein